MNFPLDLFSIYLAEAQFKLKFKLKLKFVFLVIIHQLFCGCEQIVFYLFKSIFLCSIIFLIILYIRYIASIIKFIIDYYNYYNNQLLLSIIIIDYLHCESRDIIVDSFNNYCK